VFVSQKKNLASLAQNNQKHVEELAKVLIFKLK
jgi:hypothetical protein